MSNRKNNALWKDAYIDSIPVISAYLPLGIVWGILWEQLGLPPLWGVAYSLSIYSAATQFIALSLLSTEASLLSMLITVVPIAIRNSFYTLTLSDKFPEHFLAKMYATFSLVDTAFAILVSKPKEQAKNARYAIPLGLFIQSYWVIGATLGIYFGTYIPNGIASLDFSLLSLLAILAFNQALKLRSWQLPLITLMVAGLCWYLVQKTWMIASLTLCIGIILLMPEKKKVSS